MSGSSLAVADTPDQWLAGYFHTRAHLASRESDFHCNPACTRPGCRNISILVPVSLVDLLGVARHCQKSVAATYQRYYALGLFPHEQNDWIRKVALRLNKPCPFLEQDLCRIYPVRPLACVLFPEDLVRTGRFEIEAGKELFKEFLCLRSPMLLSPQRAEIVWRIKEMWEREMLISSYYLFNHGRCHLDVSNLTQEFLQVAATLGEAGALENPAPPNAIPNQVVELFFQKRLAGCQPFAGVGEKIALLDNREGQGQLLQLFQDDGLMQKLWRKWDDRDLVFRFAKGKLKSTRRSLLPHEYRFY